MGSGSEGMNIHPLIITVGVALTESFEAVATPAAIRIAPDDRAMQFRNAAASRTPASEASKVQVEVAKPR